MSALIEANRVGWEHQAVVKLAVGGAARIGSVEARPPIPSDPLSEQPFSAAALRHIKPAPRGLWPRRRGIIATTMPRASPGQHRNAGDSSTTKE